LPTLEPVEHETVTAANDAVAETSTVAATEVVDADELPTLEPVEEDGELVTSHGLAACTTNDSAAWQPDTDGDVAVLDASSAEEFTAPTATEWSPESDAEAAVAVAIAEPMTAVEEVAQPAAVAAAAPAAAVANASETTAPPAPPPTVASAAPSRADSELEQMQHHVLTALEQVQTNLTAALEQLRAVTPPDVSPALADLRTELGRQGEMLAANVAAVQQLDERLGGLGDAVQQATTAATQLAAAPATAAAATPLVEPVSLRAPLAVAALGATWSVLLWWKTGSTALATGTLVAANLVAGLWLGRGRG